MTADIENSKISLWIKPFKITSVFNFQIHMALIIESKTFVMKANLNTRVKHMRP
jgi:hypothetical protein